MNNRRKFLSAVGGTTAALGFSPFDFQSRLPRVSAQEAKLAPSSVRFAPDIEPLVRLLEDTPRERVVQVFAEKIRSGTSYQQVLAALLLAGVRNVQPRPSVGFKFHAVLVVNSAHLASLASADDERWLPIFWALDYFKSSQARDVREGNWTMAAVDEPNVPPPHKARAAFIKAMDEWDVEAADVSITGLARSAGANEIFELLAHYGCRDFRSIGHKAIYVANAYRTLQCIGWRHSEPVLRSLTYALLNHNGEPNPAQSDLKADAACRVTETLVDSFDRPFSSGRRESAVTHEVLNSLRSESPDSAVRMTSGLLNDGIHPQSIIDGLFLSAGEMLMQQPGIIALHASTSTNALQYAVRTASDDATRYRLLLQNAAFIPHFRQSMTSRGKVAEERIDSLIERKSEGQNASDGSAAGQGIELDSIFDAVGRDRKSASNKTLDFLASGGGAENVMRAARRLIFLKGNDSHDYKFSSAALEDFYSISSPFRNSYLAASTYLLHGSKDRDNGLIEKVRSALA